MRPSWSTLGASSQWGVCPWMRRRAPKCARYSSRRRGSTNARRPRGGRAAGQHRPAARPPQPRAGAGVARRNAVAEPGVGVVVGVLHECAVVEQDEEGQAAQPRLELGIGVDRVEVRPVATTVQPERLELAGVAGPPRFGRFHAAPPLQHGEKEEVVVAENGPAVPPGAGDARGGGTASPAWLPALEEVTEEDGVHVVLRIPLESLLEALDIALDITDDEQRTGHLGRIGGQPLGFSVRPRFSAARRVLATSVAARTNCLDTIRGPGPPGSSRRRRMESMSKRSTMSSPARSVISRHSAAVMSRSVRPSSSVRLTASATKWCAARKGRPRSTRYSATSVASSAGSDAAARRTRRLNRSTRTTSVTTASVARVVSTASKRAALSSWRSRL